MTPKKRSYPYLLDGKLQRTGKLSDVTNPYDGSVVGRYYKLPEASVEQAIASTAAASAAAQALPAHARAAALVYISGQIEKRAEEFAQLITSENGKPLMWSRGEVARGISTFRWAAEEARRFSGELQRLDTEASATGRIAVVRRFPRGPILGISPFNFPLNLVAHKIAPAIAAGAPILLKPAGSTPLTAMLLGSIIAETELPAGMVNIVAIPGKEMDTLVTDPRLPVITFTGSGAVGQGLLDKAPRKHHTLELGGNGAAIVAPDWDDLDKAADRLATFANYQAGQSCIAVQRIYVHKDQYDAFIKLLTKKVKALKTGDPAKSTTVVGPVIDEGEATRIVDWIGEAKKAGATVLTGGRRRGTTVAPTVLVDVPKNAKVSNDEVFGPVLTVKAYRTLDEAFRLVNDSRYGLQAGVFTKNIETAFRAHRELQVGGVIVGDVPSFRADQMPYGGWKESGVGREGIASAIEDYTEARVMVLTGLDL
ncbi:succinate semialdehyde dehydrogenase [Antricoccus suffuscus]|uniref:Succinate semialdehyde dehydrogenase n=1 Tax=Antricoccus suffuscus TaxID=1629062 RepID=A0A2T0ZY01_9ACTN|nr:aldehyde dehydrogenase family protein [Antricoccus suffuscus]PRZ41164.1 succinate semialdehyde dehydrogenase [Antricoccus suffuscus]